MSVRMMKTWLAMGAILAAIAPAGWLGAELPRPAPRGIDVIHTADGKTLEGKVSFDGAKILVKRRDNSETRLDLEQVADLTFATAPAGKPAPDAPAAGPSERHGVLAQFFADKAMTRFVMSRVDPRPELRVEWGQTPDPIVPKYFSVRWTGYLKAEATESHRFVLGGHGFVRMWVDDKLLIDGRASAAYEHKGEISLQAGRMYLIRVEYNNFGLQPGVRIVLKRHVKGVGDSEIPEDRFYLPATDNPRGYEQRVSPGLIGQYFDDERSVQARVTRIDPLIEFKGSSKPIHPAMGRNYVVRWTGQLQVPVGAAWTFYLEGRDFFRLWIDDQKVIDNWNQPRKNDQPLASAPIGLDAKSRHGICLEYELNSVKDDGQWHSGCTLMWSAPLYARQVISPEFLYPTADGFNVAVSNPADREAVTCPGHVKLAAEVRSERRPVTQVDFFDGNHLVGTCEHQPWQVDYAIATPGRHMIVAKASRADGMTAISSPVTLLAEEKPGVALRAPWVEALIGGGASAAPPMAAVSQGKLIIKGGRGDLSTASDTFNFVYQPVNGNCQIVAHLLEVKNEDGRNDAARVYAGVMLRDDLGPADRHVALMAGPAGSAMQVCRPGGKGTLTGEAPVHAPCWLKITREETTVKTFRSADGKTWDLITVNSVPLPPSIFVGLAALCVGTDGPCAAVFDSVQITNVQASLPQVFKGVQLVSGSLIAGMPRDAYTQSHTLKLLKEGGQEMRVPLDGVARIFYKPLLPERLATLKSGTAGILLTNGDYAEGEVRSIDSKIVVLSSVLFGLQKFDLSKEVAAIVLRDAKTPTTGIVVDATDGSVYRSGKFKLADGKLAIEDGAMGAIELSEKEIAAVKIVK